MLRGIWRALNCLSIHATYCVIVAWASPGKTKMWAAVRENGDFFHHRVATYTTLVYRSYTDTKHRAASLQQQSFFSNVVVIRHDKCKKNCCFITMCKAHSKVTHIKQQKYFHHLKRPGYNTDFLLYARPFR